MPFSAIFETASGCCLYFKNPHLKGKKSLLFDKEYVVLPFASPLIPWFLRCWQVRVSRGFEFDVDHKKLGHFMSFWKIKDRTPTWRFGKMIFFFNWVPCLGTM